jgi:hypothetical protein
MLSKAGLRFTGNIMVYMSIPFTFEDKKFEIKSLGAFAKASSPEAGLISVLKDSLVLSSLLSDAKIVKFSDHRRSEFFHLELPLNEEVLKLIYEKEPLVADRTKKANKAGLIQSPSPEEILEHGY